MLHIKFQGHWLGSDGEEIFKVMSILLHNGHLGQVTLTV